MACTSEDVTASSIWIFNLYFVFKTYLGFFEIQMYFHSSIDLHLRIWNENHCSSFPVISIQLFRELFSLIFSSRDNLNLDANSGENQKYFNFITTISIFTTNWNPNNFPWRTVREDPEFASRVELYLDFIPIVQRPFLLRQPAASIVKNSNLEKFH